MWNERVSYCSVTQRLITAQKGTRIYKKNRLICLFQSLCDQFFESIFQINCNRRRHSPQAFVQSTFVRRTFWACPFGSGYSFQVLAVSNRSGLSTAIPHATLLILIVFLFLILNHTQMSFQKLTNIFFGKTNGA